MMSPDWSELIGFAYLAAAGVIGVSSFLAIWVAAISQSGIVWGGTVGLVPAWVGGMIVGLGWPIALIGGLIWSDPVLEWIGCQFEPRQRG